MKKIILAIMALLTTIASCEKVPDSSAPELPPGETPYSTTAPAAPETTTSAQVTETTAETAQTTADTTTSAETVTTTETTTAPVTEPPSVPQAFDLYSDYTAWAQSTGYPSGVLDPEGVSGLNQDYFHTLPGTAGYDSGRIVIGDSRCCQLGIYQCRSGRSDYATFAVWGGHYVAGSGGIMTEAHIAEVQECFRSQVQNTGKCEIYLFATVNDYDCWSNANSQYINAAVSCARRLASMSCEYGGNTVYPQVYVIGFDGCWTTGDLFGTPQETFNRYVSDYNSRLYSAVQADSVLGANAQRFTTVPEISGGKAEFIDDGLHYADGTLAKICAHITSS